MKKAVQILLSVIMSFLIMGSNGFKKSCFAWLIYSDCVAVDNISVGVNLQSGKNASSKGFDDATRLMISADNINWSVNLRDIDLQMQPTNLLPSTLEPVSYNPSANSFINLYCTEEGEFSAAAATGGYVKFTFFIKSTVDALVSIVSQFNSLSGCVYSAVKTGNSTQIINSTGPRAYYPVRSTEATGTDINLNGIMDAAEADSAGFLGPLVTPRNNADLTLNLIADITASVTVYMWAEVQDLSAHLENPVFSTANINITGFLIDAENNSGANVLTNAVVEEGALELSPDGQTWESELINEDYSAVQSNSFSPELIQPVSFNPTTQLFSGCVSDGMMFNFFPASEGTFISYTIYARLPYYTSSTTVVSLRPALIADSVIFYSAIYDGANIYLYSSGGDRSYFPVIDSNLTLVDTNGNSIIDQFEAPQTSLGSMVTADNTNEISLTFTEPNEVKELTVFMWAEGQDAACNFFDIVSAETMRFSLFFVAPELPVSSLEFQNGAVVNGEDNIIYGFDIGLTQTRFENEFVHIIGNGRLEYTRLKGEFGTGTKVDLIDDLSNVIIVSYTIVIFGDVNGDGGVDSIDAGAIVDYENYLVSWDPSVDVALFKAGDLNGDGCIDSIDAGIAVDAENYLVTIDQTTGLATV